MVIVNTARIMRGVVDMMVIDSYLRGWELFEHYPGMSLNQIFTWSVLKIIMVGACDTYAHLSFKWYQKAFVDYLNFCVAL